MDYKLELQNNNTDIQNNNIDLGSILDVINALPDASDGLDTSDATATAADIAEGVTAYVNGEKITGNIPIASEHLEEYDYVGMSSDNFFAYSQEGVFWSDLSIPQTAIYEQGDKLSYIVNRTAFGDANVSDVTKGKTFTSQNGVKLVGTHECSSGADTSDATALAEDIISGKTAYINGGKVTGTLTVQAYYAGDTEPDDSFGNDGDLYFVRGE